jgi:hypothetical protein
VRGRHDLQEPVLAELRQRGSVARQYGLERLAVLPLRMLRRHRLHPVERQGDLEIDRLLGPQRAVVVEGGDALFDRDKVRAALRRDAGDEIGDGFLHRTVVPRSEWIGLHQMPLLNPAFLLRCELPEHLPKVASQFDI